MPLLRRAALKSCLGAALLLPMATTTWAQTKWDLPSAYPAHNFHTENIVQFTQDVEKASGGKLKITVHSNASLFKANEIKRAVQGSQAQVGEILLTAFGNENPIFELDSVPFLATSYAQSFKLYQAQKPALDKVLGAQGLKVLFSVPWGPQGVYSKKPLTSVADMKGLKWRAYSPPTARIAELVGATPVTVQAAELSQALATGLVDSYMSSMSTGYDSKTYESISHYYDVQAWLPRNAVIVNQKAFDSLDKATQEAVLKAAADAETRGWKLSDEKNAWYAAELTKRNMTVEKAPAELEAGLKKVGDTMLNDWLKRAGADGQAVVDAYRK